MAIRPPTDPVRPTHPMKSSCPKKYYQESAIQISQLFTNALRQADQQHVQGQIDILCKMRAYLQEDAQQQDYTYLNMKNFASFLKQSAPQRDNEPNKVDLLSQLKSKGLKKRKLRLEDTQQAHLDQDDQLPSVRASKRVIKQFAHRPDQKLLECHDEDDQDTQLVQSFFALPGNCPEQLPFPGQAPSHELNLY